jgi:DNA-directed RNA polymerase specialized sigma subunit
MFVYLCRKEGKLSTKGKLRYNDLIAYDIADTENSDNSGYSVPISKISLLGYIERVCISILTPKQYRVYRMYYGERKNTRVIAEELGVSQQSVAKMLKVVRTKITRSLPLWNRK